MTGRRAGIPIGVQDFREIREGGYYYVDKSELISDIVAQRAKVYLFTRPRRFGKSLNLSMIQRFFDIRDKGNRWFDGLKVMEHPEAVSMMSTRPVIRLDMKGLGVRDFELFRSDLSLIVSDVFNQFGYLLESDRISEADRNSLRRCIDDAMSESELKRSFRFLCRLLREHHGIAPVVLIDEYDNPINNAHGRNAYEDILGLLRDFYTNTLKGNDDLGFAVVTGVMQIAKESIFSGLNSLEVNNIFSVESDERYGFTPSEVQEMCSAYGHPEAFDTAREWYDGYRFGNAEIYNPWSVLKFVKSGFVAATYWAGTSGNDIIDTLLDHADEDTYQDLDDLANGRAVLATITPTVVMADIGTSRNAVYSVMAMSGYLNAVEREEGYEISIPNREMRSVFASMMEHRVHSDAQLAFDMLFNGLEEKDVQKVRRGMQRILDRSIPFILLTEEKSYQLIIGAAAMSRLGRYTVSLEEESGDGRADIIMKRSSPRYPDIVLELKRVDSDSPEALRNTASTALKQIRDREYFRQLDGHVLMYGLSFRSKRLEIAFEELHLRRYRRSAGYIRTEDVPIIMAERRAGIPIGIQDFAKIREGDYYYVDKSELISDIVSQKAEVYLFTRPRRFGKSLNLSMMQRFFDIRDRGNRWFDGLKVMEHPEAVSMMSTRPVIRIDMKDLSVEDGDRFVRSFAFKLAGLFKELYYLIDSPLIDDIDKDFIRRGRLMRLSEEEMAGSLKVLCGLLNAHHGIAPVVLIDEYDNPINNAHGKAAYDKVMGFLRLFYSAALKGNDDLGFAVVTGVMQIAKESIFSGLNSLYVNNIFSERYDERYGFTPSEVREMCAAYGNQEAFDTAKEWYDGYRFGKAEIYNPWSVLNFVDSGFIAKTYWAGTSGNDILDTLIVNADEDVYSELQNLGNGGAVTDKDVTPAVVMADIGIDPDAVYSVMAMTGYLNAVPDGDGYSLSIPNKEMYDVFSRTIVTRGTSVSYKVFNGFFDAAEKNNTTAMERYAFRIFAGNFQDWDLPDEGAYRRILAGAAMCRDGRFTVTTEAQSGNGRSDMIMTRNSPAVPNIVMEFKKSVSDDPVVMQKDAEAGISQIMRKEYFLELRGRTILFGIVFANKKARVVSEVLELP